MMGRVKEGPDLIEIEPRKNFVRVIRFDFNFAQENGKNRATVKFVLDYGAFIYTENTKRNKNDRME